MRNLFCIPSRSSKASPARGFTLTEMAVVLGVIGIVIAGIWTAAATVYQNKRVATTARDVLNMATSIRALLGQRNVIDPALVAGGEITPFLENANLIPPDMQLMSTTDPNWGTKIRPIHQWNSYMSSYAMSSTTFRLSFYNLPISACVALETAVAGSSVTGAPIGVGSWYTSTKGAAYGASTYLTLPLANNAPFSPTVAQSVCGGTASDPSTSGAVSAEFDFSVY